MSSLLAQNKVISLGEASLPRSLFRECPNLPCSHPCLLCLCTAGPDNSLAPWSLHTQKHELKREKEDADGPLSNHYRSVWVCYCYCIRMRMLRRLMLSKNVNLLSSSRGAKTDDWQDVFVCVWSVGKINKHWSGINLNRNNIVPKCLMKLIYYYTFIIWFSWASWGEQEWKTWL